MILYIGLDTAAKIAASNSSNLPKKAATRYLLNDYKAKSEEPPADLKSNGSFIFAEEAQRELDMLHILLNVGGSGVGSEPDFFYKGIFAEIPLIEKELETLPIMGVQYKELIASDVIDEIEALLGEITDVGNEVNVVATEFPDNEDDEDDKKSLSAEQEVDSLRERVKVKSGEAHDLGNDLQTVIMKQNFAFSNSGKRSRKDYQPTEEELAVINDSYSNTQLTPMDIFVYNLESADMNVDRQHEQFTENALKTMAAMSLDKAFLIDHSWTTENQIGKIFAAEARDGKLHQKVYVLNDPMNDRVNKNIMAGIFNKVSVGFSTNLKDMHCASCADGKSIYDSSCPHMPGGYDDKGARTFVKIQDIADYFEVSLVPIPAQRDAGIRRNSSAKSKDAPVESRRRSMTLTPEIIKAWEQGQSNTASEEQLIAETQQNKNLDTITSGNNLSGELFVSEPTTKTSMEAAGTSETGANPAPDSFSVPSPLPGVYDQERDAIADAAQDAASDPGIHTTAGEDKDATPEPKQPEWDKEPRKVPGTKELKKTVKSLKKIVKAMQSLLDEQKAVIASTKDRTEAITLAMTAQDEKLKALTGIVEAAIKCNLDSLNRTTAPNTVARKTNDGDSWAVDLSKRLVGGN